MNSTNLLILSVTILVCWIGCYEAGPLKRPKNELEVDNQCRDLCSHCGCTGFYCGDECICDCHQDEIDVKCVETMHSNCQKLKLPFEVLIQGPSGNRFVRKLVTGEQTAMPKEQPSVIRRARSTVSIYKPDEQKSDVVRDARGSAGELTNEATATAESKPNQSVIASLSEKEIINTDSEQSTMATIISAIEGSASESEPMAPREKREDAPSRDGTSDDAKPPAASVDAAAASTDVAAVSTDVAAASTDAAAASTDAAAVSTDAAAVSTDVAAASADTAAASADAVAASADVPATSADAPVASQSEQPSGDTGDASTATEGKNDDRDVVQAPVAEENTQATTGTAGADATQDADGPSAAIAEDEPQVGATLGLPLLPLAPLKIGKLSLLGAGIPAIKSKIDLKLLQAQAVKNIAAARIGVKKHLAAAKLATVPISLAAVGGPLAAAKAATIAHIQAIKAAAKFPVLPKLI